MTDLTGLGVATSGSFAVGEHRLRYKAGRGPFDGRWICRLCGETQQARNSFREVDCINTPAMGPADSERTKQCHD